MMAPREERLWRQYVAFFEKAERARRWNVFTDVPWDRIKPDASEELALCAETFAAVELYLPDYVAGGISVVRESFGQAWFQASWGYEESKHSLALLHWLMRSGRRTERQIFDLQRTIAAGKWTVPFPTARQMTCYGCVQELATCVIYVKHRAWAAREGDECLRTIYDYIARDEMAHARFYQGVIRILLEEDREGTLADLAHVFANFQMPGLGLVPDYDARILTMRAAGIDRDVFIRKVYLPILTGLGVGRHEIVRVRKVALAPRADATEAANRTSALEKDAAPVTSGARPPTGRPDPVAA